jgi:small subunit ribosomal protein S9
VKVGKGYIAECTNSNPQSDNWQLVIESWLCDTTVLFDNKLFILDEFLKEQLLQYNIGKRHLANMMGEDPETFTQEDVDVSMPEVT